MQRCETVRSSQCFRCCALVICGSARVQLQEHVLRQLLGIGAAAREAQRDAEDARAVQAQQLAEGPERSPARAKFEKVESAGAASSGWSIRGNSAICASTLPYTPG